MRDTGQKSGERIQSGVMPPQSIIVLRHANHIEQLRRWRELVCERRSPLAQSSVEYDENCVLSLALDGGGEVWNADAKPQVLRA